MKSSQFFDNSSLRWLIRRYRGPKADMQLVGDPLFPPEYSRIFQKELQEFLVGNPGREERGRRAAEREVFRYAWSPEGHLASAHRSHRVGSVFDHILKLAHIPGPLVI